MSQFLCSGVAGRWGHAPGVQVAFRSRSARTPNRVPPGVKPRRSHHTEGALTGTRHGSRFPV